MNFSPGTFYITVDKHLMDCKQEIKYLESRTCTRVPVLFTQLYCIHVWDEFSMKPIVYSCCKDNSEQCYHELLQSLLIHATKNKKKGKEKELY